jgi:hypothetical protein
MASAAVMQPYFIPYLGYFQLMQACDVFMFYDDAQYVKRSWMNRNRLFVGSAVDYYTIPIQAHSHTALINEIALTDEHDMHVKGLMKKFDRTYSKAQYFEETRDILDAVLKADSASFSGYVVAGLEILANRLKISFLSRLASESEIDSGLRGQEKLLSLVESVGAETYLNLPGGRTLYQSSDFTSRGLKLRFIDPHLPDRYESSTSSLSRLSIIDTLAHYGVEQTTTLVSHYEICE